jgi:hypothetical protein
VTDDPNRPPKSDAEPGADRAPGPDPAPQADPAATLDTPDPAARPGPPTVWQGISRVEQLATWVGMNRARFTDAALEREAVAAGYAPEEFTAGLALLDARERQDEAIKPVRRTAQRVVLGAYGLVWLLFAIPYLVAPYLTNTNNYGGGAFLQSILTVSLVVALAISLIWVRGRSPDPTRFGRAMVILLVVPVILLVGVAGLCLPFVGTTSLFGDVSLGGLG